MPPLALIFLGAVLATIVVAFLLVSRMAHQLRQNAVGEQRASLFRDLVTIVRRHHFAFPQSSHMLGFWLSVIFLIVWLACLGLSLATHQ